MYNTELETVEEVPNKQKQQTLLFRKTNLNNKKHKAIEKVVEFLASLKVKNLLHDKILAIRYLRRSPAIKLVHKTVMIKFNVRIQS